MVDFAMDVHKNLYPDQEIPNTLIEKLKGLQENMEKIQKIFEDEEVSKMIQNSRDGRVLFESLQKSHDFQPEMVDKLYEYAKFQFECGNYTAASEYLYFCRVLLPPSNKNYLPALWGKLASEILMQNWESALDDLNRLKEIIDTGAFSPLQSLQQRTWLIHWSLFVFFNHPKGRDLIIDMFLYQQQYLNAIQTQCPHILRYLTTAVITSKNSRRNVKIIQQESYTYKDPITEFLECLYVNFDFDGAQTKLAECETVLCNDFFLTACLDDFIENARLFIFETFCRIHQCISITMLAGKLNMPEDEAERWIVDLIRNARLDAKIDSKQGHVVMGTQAAAVHEQVIERTKGLMYRTQMVSASIDKKLASQQKITYAEPFTVAWGAYDG